jgi:RNA-dependent RNA polymerase
VFQFLCSCPFSVIQGPFLESSKTHLQRVLGDENILQVKFEEISQEKKTKFDFDDYYCDVYHRVAQQGIKLGLRHYQFLGMLSYALIH